MPTNFIKALAILIGVVSGFGAVMFYEAINLCSSLLLSQVTGYIPPRAGGEGGTATFPPSRPYLIPLVTTLGGLLSGVIVYRFAPEAEGHGTDAAIDAFHNRNGEIRSRIPVVKLLASAITIGSGGSAGREGPTAQIGAGFGSYLGKVLHLNSHDRRIAVAVGISAGIGSIFKAPFGGALLGTEILYMGDFEVEALLPAFIASTVGYSIFGFIMGWSPIFSLTDQYAFHDPFGLTFYAILGVVCGLVGIVYVRSFYGVRDFFQGMRIPRIIKPALGGLIVGILGMFFPQVLGGGYGWLQIAMNGGFVFLPLALILFIILAKIFATSLSIGSGGSGGVFAPALVIGGLLGETIWSVLKIAIPNIEASPAPFIIVGMMSFFGGVGKVPVAVIIMVSEMTGDYTLLVPSMIATTIAYIITGRNTIYRSQVRSESESPAHRKEYSVPLLQKLFVRDAMVKNVITVDPDLSLAEVAKAMAENGIKGMPVVDSTDDLIGVVTLTDILKVDTDQREKKTVGTVMTRELVVTEPNESLYGAFQKMTGNQIGRLPVVDPADNRKLIGLITRGDIGRIYNIEILSRLKETSA